MTFIRLLKTLATLPSFLQMGGKKNTASSSRANYGSNKRGRGNGKAHGQKFRPLTYDEGKPDSVVEGTSGDEENDRDDQNSVEDDVKTLPKTHDVKIEVPVAMWVSYFVKEELSLLMQFFFFHFALLAMFLCRILITVIPVDALVNDYPALGSLKI